MSKQAGIAVSAVSPAARNAIGADCKIRMAPQNPQMIPTFLKNKTVDSKYSSVDTVSNKQSRNDVMDYFLGYENISIKTTAVAFHPNRENSALLFLLSILCPEIICILFVPLSVIRHGCSYWLSCNRKRDFHPTGGA